MKRWSSILAVAAGCSVLVPSSRGALSVLEYQRLRLGELCLFADGIAAGTVRSVDAASFVLEPDWMVTDGDVPATLRVKCFEDWTCAHRWTEYEPGQRVLLFLAHDAGSDPSWSILGGGGEGEMPFLGERVVLRGFRVPGVESREHEVRGAKVKGSLVHVEELKAAICRLRPACRVERSVHDGEWPFLRAAENGETIAACLGGSALERHLALDAMSSDSWRGWSTDTPILLREDVVHLVFTSQLGVVRRAASRFEGNFPQFGASAALIGDVNGDGALDLAVGAPGDCHRPGCSGVLWIFFLTSDGEVIAQQEIGALEGALDLKLSKHAGFATSVAAVGDLDADGVPDLAVGAPSWRDGDRFAGCAWTLLLRKDGTVKEANVVGGGPSERDVDAYPGQGLSLLGDLDADGFPELVGGLDHSDEPPFDRDDPLIELVSLARGGGATRSRSILHAEIAEAQYFCSLGQAVCGVGDVDGDGVPDVAVANPEDSESADQRGAVWILFLEANGEVRAKNCISAWSGGFDGLLHNRSEFGSTLAAPGDVDGDRIPDLLVGSTEGLWLLSLRSDGSVREHRLYRGIGLTGIRSRAPTAIAASRSHEDPQLVRVVLAGPVPDDDRDEPCLWLFDLGRDGSVSRWR